MRVFEPTSFEATAISFRDFGPLRRFDHHRAGTDGTPTHDPDRGIWYGAPTLPGCLVEVFRDTGVIDPADRLVAIPDVTRELVLLDLRRNGAMRAGSVAALCKTADLDITQAWSRYFHDDPNGNYGEVDGLIYLNAHNDDETIALYEHAHGSLRCSRNQIVRLDDAAMRPAVFATAAANNLDVVAY